MILKKNCADAEKTRFDWQTTHPFVAKKEKDLLRGIFTELPGDRILEVGCGESANIVNMRLMNKNRRWIGMDISPDKVTFCRSHGPGRFLCADGLMLPFKSNSFDIVFARDFLHHVDHVREIAVHEMIRVCKENGKIVLLEANGRKLIYRIFRLIDRSEVGMRNSTPAKLRRFMEKYNSLVDHNIFMLEPSIFFRLVFHYRVGIGRIGLYKLFQWLSQEIEQISVKICPEDRWGYIVVVATKK